MQPYLVFLGIHILIIIICCIVIICNTFVKPIEYIIVDFAYVTMILTFIMICIKQKKEN